MPLSALKIDDLIQQLADLRETLAPQIPMSPTPLAKFMALPVPEWHVSQELREDGRSLFIRHPGLGWLAFLIPHQDCARLAKHLTRPIK